MWKGKEAGATFEAAHESEIRVATSLHTNHQHLEVPSQIPSEWVFFFCSSQGHPWLAHKDEILREGVL